MFERALRINHVNHGLYNFDQFKIYDGLTEGYLGMEEFEEANFFQEAQLEIHQRKSGTDNPAIVPGMYKLAEWYERSGQIDIAMQTYRNADNILRKADRGDLDPRRVQAFEGIAHIYERAGNTSSSASWLKRALNIVDSQSPIDYERRALVLVRLGDLYARAGKIDRAQVRYAEAWQDLSRNDDYLGLREKYFANPVRVAGQNLSALAYAPNSRDKPENALSDGYVLISYAVTANGRTENVKVIESTPPGMMDKALVSTFTRSYFRPRLVDGVPVDTDGLLYQLNFRYLDSASHKARNDAGKRLEYPESGADSAGPEADRLSHPEQAED